MCLSDMKTLGPVHLNLIISHVIRYIWYNVFSTTNKHQPACVETIRQTFGSMFGLTGWGHSKHTHARMNRCSNQEFRTQERRGGGDRGRTEPGRFWRRSTRSPRAGPPPPPWTTPPRWRRRPAQGWATWLGWFVLDCSWPRRRPSLLSVDDGDGEEDDRNEGRGCL